MQFCQVSFCRIKCDSVPLAIEACCVRIKIKAAIRGRASETNKVGV